MAVDQTFLASETGMAMQDQVSGASAWGKDQHAHIIKRAQQHKEYTVTEYSTFFGITAILFLAKHI
jgi:hypothetical protein